MEEWVSIPSIKIHAIKAKIDSGAEISSIHAFNIQLSLLNNKEFVSFDVNPIQNNRLIKIQCQLPVIDKKIFRSSNGGTEMRYIVSVEIQIGKYKRKIRLSLASRESMGYRMIIGKEAIPDKVLIDTRRSFLLRHLCAEYVAEEYIASNKEFITSEKLKIGILCSNEKIYSNQRLLEEGAKRGHSVTFLKVKHCYLKVSGHLLEIYYRGGQKLVGFDAIIPRLKASTAFYGCALLRQFQARNIYCLNSPSAIADSRDKLRCLQLLASKHISVPTTSFAHSIKDVKHLLKMEDTDSMVLKLLESTHGKGVILLENKNAIESVMTAFEKVKANVLLQEFIKDANGSDIRCFVVDGKVVATMKRTAHDGDFRSNLHLGGAAQKVRITQREKRLALDAVKVLGLDLAGVDIIRSKKDSFIIEVNPSPGLEGIERVSSVNIASLIFDCIEKNVHG